jgi:dGTP triphosphohydrolase
MITYFVDGVAFEGERCRHDGKLLKDRDPARARQKEMAIDIQKYILRSHVIDSRQLRTLQHGQALIVETLLETYVKKPEMLPVDRQDEWKRHGHALRAARRLRCLADRAGCAGALPTPYRRADGCSHRRSRWILSRRAR